MLKPFCTRTAASSCNCETRMPSLRPTSTTARSTWSIPLFRELAPGVPHCDMKRLPAPVSVDNGDNIDASPRPLLGVKVAASVFHGLSLLSLVKLKQVLLSAPKLLLFSMSIFAREPLDALCFELKDGKRLPGSGPPGWPPALWPGLQAEKPRALTGGGAGATEAWWEAKERTEPEPGTEPPALWRAEPA